jgi:hypothetical protein
MRKKLKPGDIVVFHSTPTYTGVCKGDIGIIKTMTTNGAYIIIDKSGRTVWSYFERLEAIDAEED